MKKYLLILFITLTPFFVFAMDTPNGFGIDSGTIYLIPPAGTSTIGMEWSFTNNGIASEYCQLFIGFWNGSNLGGPVYSCSVGFSGAKHDTFSMNSLPDSIYEVSIRVSASTSTTNGILNNSATNYPMYDYSLTNGSDVANQIQITLPTNNATTTRNQSIDDMNQNMTFITSIFFFILTMTLGICYTIYINKKKNG